MKKKKEKEREMTAFLLCSWTAKRARLSISALFWEPLQSWTPPSLIFKTEERSRQWPNSHTEQSNTNTRRTGNTLTEITFFILKPLSFFLSFFLDSVPTQHNTTQRNKKICIYMSHSLVEIEAFLRVIKSFL